MRLSDATKVDKNIRERQKAKNLLAQIERRLDFYHRRLQHKLQLTHLLRATEASSTLARFIRQTGEQNEHDELENELSGEIKSSLSSRKMIKEANKETLAHIFEGLPEPTQREYTDYESELLQTLNEAGINKRAATQRITLAYEIAYRAQQGWYIVFSTLTAQPRYLKAIFSKESTLFKEYIRNYVRMLPGKERDNKEHTYFAVVEEGGKTGRLHIHVIHLHKELPHGCRDPNFGSALPVRWEIDKLKSLWSDKGWIVPKAVRYSPIDAFGKLGWRWPWDEEKQQPYEIGSPLRLSSYMSKYILKSYAGTKREKYQWRIRKTQQLGMQLLQELLCTLTMQDLLNLATNDNLTAKLNNEQIPPNLLREQALRSYQNRNQYYSKKHNTELEAMARNMPSRPSPLQPSLASTRRLQENNQQSITLTRIAPTTNMEDFSGTIFRLEKAAERINAKYFAKPTTGWGTTTVRDHTG